MIGTIKLLEASVALEWLLILVDVFVACVQISAVRWVRTMCAGVALLHLGLAIAIVCILTVLVMMRLFATTAAARAATRRTCGGGRWTRSVCTALRCLLLTYVVTCRCGTSIDYFSRAGGWWWPLIIAVFVSVEERKGECLLKEWFWFGGKLCVFHWNNATQFQLSLALGNLEFQKWNNYLMRFWRITKLSFHCAYEKQNSFGPLFEDT